VGRRGWADRDTRSELRYSWSGHGTGQGKDHLFGGRGQSVSARGGECREGAAAACSMRGSSSGSSSAEGPTGNVQIIKRVVHSRQCLQRLLVNNFGGCGVCVGGNNRSTAAATASMPTAQAGSRPGTRERECSSRHVGVGVMCSAFGGVLQFQYLAQQSRATHTGARGS
jgi:hypothetical protein